MISEFANSLRNTMVFEGLAPNDMMVNPVSGLPRYLSVGRSGLRVILTALIGRLGYPGGDTPITTILDFGAGFGRVTRFLKAVFPDAEITIADVNAEAVKWCVENLKVASLYGKLPQGRFDVIFLGSVFTHLPAEITADLLVQLTAALRQNGVLIFTAQGRYAYAEIEAHPSKAIYGRTLEQLQAIVDGYKNAGYGFAEYSQGRNYGVSVISRTWFDRQLGQMPELVQILFQEKGYDNHQDAYGYLKTSILDGGRSGL